MLAAALMVMPLQGIAATLSVLLCHSKIRAHLMQADTAGSGATHGESQSNDAGTGGGPAYHPCCHNMVSAMPCAAPPASLLQAPVRVFAPDAFHHLFFPDRPDRPPLA